MADTVINKGDNEGGSTVVQPSKVLIPLSTQNQKNRGNLGMKSMWCGCFGHREKENSPHKSLLKSTDAQLLPSCAVQCLIKSDNAESFHGGDALSGGSNASVELPSSVLVTNSLLLAANQSSIAGSDRATKEDKRMNVLWRNLKFTLRKSSFHQNQVPSPKAKVGIPPENSEKLEETPPLNEALVFSPLPSQKAPEIASGPHHAALLGPRSESDKGKKCFVIDLDETLVHSSFKVVENADFKVGVEIDGVTHRVYVLKRPHVDTFLSTMANLYECVLFTASLAKYADPVADFLDQWNAFRYRLFRESCVYHRGNYVKDLSHLGRPINQIVILDNSPASYMFHANHAVQISSWFDDDNDTALLDLIPYFERLASHPNVVDFLRNNSPPTPHAAVGTVGLPISPLASLPPAQDLSGRSPDGLIANLRRPGVVSPMQHCTPNNRSVARYVPLSISETQARLETEKTSPVPHPIGHTRFISPNAVPIITKLASPSSGPSVNPSHNAHDLHTPFPAPLSVAASVPVLPDETIPITATGQLTGDVSQVRLGSYAGSPTPNIVSPHLATPSCSPSPSLTLSYSNPINITSLFSNSLNRKDFTSDLHTRPSPPTPDQQCDSIPLLSHCSSWGENHCIPPSVDPQQVTSGTKSPDSTLHVGTSIPTTSPRSVT